MESQPAPSEASIKDMRSLKWPGKDILCWFVSAQRSGASENDVSWKIYLKSCCKNRFIVRWHAQKATYTVGVLTINLIRDSQKRQEISLVAFMALMIE